MRSNVPARSLIRNVPSTGPVQTANLPQETSDARTGAIDVTLEWARYQTRRMDSETTVPVHKMCLSAFGTRLQS